MREIQDIIDGVNKSYQNLRHSDVPDDVKVTAGRAVRLLIADMSGLQWSVENCPERWS
ncbi:hypothetical protein [Amycolatopsis coloradensis]|jgi:hypothetical protein|uniref:hypothetical protein n=1 Tax=Amycolatopsis coloradensis TaxID=76021 RepID=UPI0013016185|nr:hypothetical protein [Amycolatopsis coloradensis]